MSFCQRGDERGFPNAACSDNCNEFAHEGNYKIIQPLSDWIILDISLARVFPNLQEIASPTRRSGLARTEI
jgi:hypothetical protein